jgi:hypothetical protein
MKKTITSLVILLMFLVPAMGNASYLIRLKNGGQLATPAYWTEGNWIFFYCPGGIAGMERREIDRIEWDKTDYNMGAIEGNIGKKAPPPPPAAEKAKEPGKSPQAAEPAKGVEEKVNIDAYKSKKDQMTVELDVLLEKQREAAGRGDDDAKEKARVEMVKEAKEIYKLTDEVTKKNKGKLPDGWWEKK